ncbi:MAG: hypothetical protein ACT6Q7_00075 [Blastomonas fulva]|uniref:hypothetical protein n=1 Tax=Blastomonas fulva TaxID=1550728 RepID=UPI004033175C
MNVVAIVGENVHCCRFTTISGVGAGLFSSRYQMSRAAAQKNCAQSDIQRQPKWPCGKGEEQDRRLDQPAFERIEPMGVGIARDL